MSTQNPIDEYLERKAQEELPLDNPIDAYLRQSQASGIGSVGVLQGLGSWLKQAAFPRDEEGRPIIRPKQTDEERLADNLRIKAAGQRTLDFLDTANTIFKSLSAPGALDTYLRWQMGDEQALADMSSIAPFAVGLASSGVADPIAGVLGFPGAVLGTRADSKLPTDKAADWFKRVAADAKTATEQMALDAGLSEQSIGDAYNLGNFVGYFLPIAASLKMASLVLRTGQTLGQVMTSGAYTTDFIGGLIFGGFLQDGSAKERMGQAAWELAAFGVMRTVLMFAAPARAMRFNMARRRDLSGRLERILDDMENGRPINYATPEEVQTVVDIMTNENFVMNSPAAQELMARHEYDSALVQAILDVQGTGGNAGILRFAGTEWTDVSARVEKMRGQFPGMKFEAVRRTTGTREIPVEEIVASAYKGRSGQWYYGITHSDAIDAARAADDMQRFSNQGTPFSSDIGFRTSRDRVVNRKEAAEISKNQAIGDELMGGGLRHSTDILVPGSKSEIVRTGMTETVSFDVFDIYFGTRGLNNTQRRQLKQTGRFEGMSMHYRDQEVVYVGPARTKTGEAREGWTRIRRADGQERNVKEESLTELPFIRERTEQPARFSPMYDEFREWVDRKQRDLIAARGDLTEYDMVQMARAGKLSELLDPGNLRAFETNALIYPDELGLRGEDLIHNVVLLGKGTGEQQTIASVSRNQRRGTPSQWSKQGPEEGPWRIDQLDPETGQSVGYQTFGSVDEAMQFAQGQGLEVAQVTRKFPSGDDLARMVSESGVENVRIMDPPPAMSLDQMWDIFAREKGIPTTARDYQSMRTYIAERTRRDLWDAVPEADRKIFDRILAENEKLVEGMEFSMQQLAASKGWHSETLGDGSVVLRQLDTGLGMRFGSERAARDVLKKIVNVSKDLDPLLQTGGLGIADWSRGLPKSSSFTFDELVRPISELRKVHTQFYRNNRDWLISVEQQTGIPVWSKGFEPIQQGYSRMMADLDPYSQSIAKAWKGIGIDRRNKVADFWVRAETDDLTIAQAVKGMQAEGFSKQEINAFRRSRAIFDALFMESGIDRARYISMYYTRVKPYVEKHGHVDLQKIFGRGELRPNEVSFWAEFTRTGDLSVMDMDPAYVMQKYARTLFFSKHVKQHWDELARLTGTGGPNPTPPLRFSDLPPGLKEEKMKMAGPGVREDMPIIPSTIRKVLAEYLVAIRGSVGESTRMSREFMRGIFDRLNIDADERILEEIVNSWISMQYGAAMGVRPMAMARNMTQTMFLLYPRLGSRYMGRGLEMSMTREGMEEVFRVGAVQVKEAGIAMGDVISEQIFARSPHAMEGGLGAMALAGGLKATMRLGQAGRTMSQRSLIGYSSTDQASRAWSYWAQKLHTDDWLRRYENGQISWAKFREEGLGYFPEPNKKQFETIYNQLGREEALQNAARWASDETNFIYGMGAQPAWMQSIPGRLVGMFGTWPLWAIESYLRPMRHATRAQQLKFYARTAALTGAFANMGIQMGIDMWSWMAPLSTAGWSGGPAVEHVVNAKKMWDAPADQKAQAFRRWTGGMASLVIPGQIAFNDAMRSMDLLGAGNAELGLVSMLLGRPYDHEHMGLDYLYNPNNAFAEPIMSPETYVAREESDLPTWINTLDFREAPGGAQGGSRRSRGFDTSGFDAIMEALGGVKIDE